MYKIFFSWIFWTMKINNSSSINLVSIEKIDVKDVRLMSLIIF